VSGDPEALWAHHHAQWRDPSAVLSHWVDGTEPDRGLVRARADHRFWDLLAELEVTLLVSREYEHLVLGLSAPSGQPRTSWFRLPHPSGIAVDAERGVVHVASTRNPNQVVDLTPVNSQLARTDAPDAPVDDRPLLPVRSRYLPGALYLHDLAMIGGRLHANSVGQNAVVRLDTDGTHEAVWWPRSIEVDRSPDMRRNYIQLNSIAAGQTLGSSFFTASSTGRSRRRPGHLDYPVDRRGVVFSGRTHEPIAYGLTRPHSARLDVEGRVWVDNSGYGELGVLDSGRFVSVARLPGWTRGLCIVGRIAFVGTSRVIPRFYRYAPGLDVDRSRCGVHAVDIASGEVLGSIRWPGGNQIFSVEPLPSRISLGFPTLVGDRAAQSRLRRLSYRFARLRTEENA
jgi:uncharacterized protein (TIGR03032 family)